MFFFFNILNVLKYFYLLNYYYYKCYIFDFNSHIFIEYATEEEAKLAVDKLSRKKINNEVCKMRIIDRYSRIYYMKKKYNFVSFLVNAEKYDRINQEVLDIANNTKIRHYRLKDSGNEHSIGRLDMEHSPSIDLVNDKEKKAKDDNSDPSLMKYFCLPMVDLISFPSIDVQFEGYGETSNFNYFKNKNDDTKW